jgi:hypothetical protein
MKPPSNHTPIGTAQCSDCHKNKTVGGFAIFQMGSAGHTAVGVTSTSANCLQCHVGSYLGVTVKPVGHTTTSQNCGVCHTTGFTSFAGASFNHGGVASGTCNSCHLTGVSGAMKEPAKHVTTGTAQCDVCHKSTAAGGFSTFVMQTAGHTALGVALSSNCMTCHNGTVLGTVTFRPHPGKHNATASTANYCGNCHKSFTRSPGD